MNPVIERNAKPVPWLQRIRVRFSLLVLAFLILSLASLFFFAIIFFKAYILENKREKNLQIAHSISDETDIYMDALVREISSYSRVSNQIDDPNADMHLDFNALLKSRKEIKSLYVMDLEGRCLFSIQGGITEKGLPATPRMTGYSLEGEVLESIRKGKIYTGHVYPATNSAPIMDVAVPLMGGVNSVNGALIAVISLNGLYQRIETVALTKGQEIYLVDTGGWVIAYFSGKGGQGYLGIKGLEPLWGSAGHIKKVAQYTSGISEESLKRPMIYGNIRQEDVLGVLATCPKLGWGIIFEESVQSLYMPFCPISMRLLSATLAILFLFFSCALAFIFHITDPLIRLYRFSEDAGEAGEGIPLMAKGEAGRIAHTIDSLIKALSQRDAHIMGKSKELESLHNEFGQSYDQLAQVTEKLEVSQNDLSAQRLLTSSLIEAIDYIVVVLDQEGRVVSCNGKVGRTLQYSPSDITGRTWCDTVYPSHERASAGERLRSLIRDGATDTFEDQILTKGGDLLNMAWRASPIRNSNGMAGGMVLVGEEISERKKCEQDLDARCMQLIRNNEELENVISIVSHDLKNPLYILQDFASILLQDYHERLNEDGRYYLERIKANAEHMERLIVDLLELSRAGRVKGDWQECAIADIVQRAVMEFEPAIKSKGIEVKVAESFPVCMCDPERILQVFVNLLSNAIKFMHDTRHPRIEIGYNNRGEGHEFYVRDNGIGIDKEYHEKVFVIFQRLKDVEEEGTGVGLSIVKKIVEGHGGRVWIQSRRGEGATFFFSLPNAETKQPLSASAREQGAHIMG